jgi:hypothetical protein
VLPPFILRIKINILIFDLNNILFKFLLKDNVYYMQINMFLLFHNFYKKNILNIKTSMIYLYKSIIKRYDKPRRPELGIYARKGSILNRIKKGVYLLGYKYRMAGRLKQRLKRKVV